jgi:hypothetical protein
MRGKHNCGGIEEQKARGIDAGTGNGNRELVVVVRNGTNRVN